MVGATGIEPVTPPVWRECSSRRRLTAPQKVVQINCFAVYDFQQSYAKPLWRVFHCDHVVTAVDDMWGGCGMLHEVELDLKNIAQKFRTYQLNSLHRLSQLNFGRRSRQTGTQSIPI